jgi:3-deoxy-D-manno-octulosonic acid (KDO) 8-phosphate synthase
VEDVLLATGQRQAEHDGNRRKATIFGIASIAILIAGLVIESHFDIFPDDDGD